MRMAIPLKLIVEMDKKKAGNARQRVATRRIVEGKRYLKRNRSRQYILKLYLLVCGVSFHWLR